MKVKDFLNDEIELTPQWLLDFSPGDVLNVDNVFSSRIVYYPGAGFDGQPIRTFNNAHFAHVFIIADYLVKREEMVSELTCKDCLKGYALLDIQDIPEDKLTPNGWLPTIDIPLANAMQFVDKNYIPYCVAAIFERKPEFDESLGAERILVISLGADGIASYDALFANRHKAPTVLLIQDHGFGCNWASFGKGSILEKIAKASNTMPEYLCVEKQNVWAGYDIIENIEPEIGGMHGNRRYLFRQSIYN